MQNWLRICAYFNSMSPCVERDAEQNMPSWDVCVRESVRIYACTSVYKCAMCRKRCWTQHDTTPTTPMLSWDVCVCVNLYVYTHAHLYTNVHRRIMWERIYVFPGMLQGKSKKNWNAEKDVFWLFFSFLRLLLLREVAVMVTECFVSATRRADTKWESGHIHHRQWIPSKINGLLAWSRLERPWKALKGKEINAAVLGGTLYWAWAPLEAVSMRSSRLWKLLLELKALQKCFFKPEAIYSGRSPGKTPWGVIRSWRKRWERAHGGIAGDGPVFLCWSSNCLIEYGCAVVVLKGFFVMRNIQHVWVFFVFHRSVFSFAFWYKIADPFPGRALV